MAIRMRIQCLVSCCSAIFAMCGYAAACSFPGSMDAFLEARAITVRNFWLASLLVAGLILCLDVYQRRLSIPLLVTAAFQLLLGWLASRVYHWGAYGPDCEPVYPFSSCWG
jgi:hypothetical protein